MKFKITFWQAFDWSNFFFIERYVYHSQFTSKFFFGLHNSFLLLNYNNSFICIKRALNFLEASIINRNYIIGIGEFYNFFLKYLKIYKYLNIFNLKYTPDGFLTNFKQYFTINNIFNLNKSKINKSNILNYISKSKFIDNKFIIENKGLNHSIKKQKLNPPSIAILFNISKSFWLMNEIKITKLPLIAIVYPKTELNSKLIHYPIPVLHGLDDSFLLDPSENKEIKDFEIEKELLLKKHKKYQKSLRLQGYTVKQTHELDFLKDYKENLIDVFFLFLFILITFQAYKKLLLKFTTKSIKFLKHNSLVNKFNNFNEFHLKNFNLSKHFYKKSFLIFYTKLWSKLPINRNLLFSNKSIKYIDRSLVWKPTRKRWILHRALRKQRRLIMVGQPIYYNKPKFWLQKKYVIKFKGFNLLKRLKIKKSRFIPFIRTLMSRNLISSPTDRIMAEYSRRDNNKRFNANYKPKNNLFSFFYKVLRNWKRKNGKSRRRSVLFNLNLVKNDDFYSKWTLKLYKNFKYESGIRQNIMNYIPRYIIANMPKKKIKSLINFKKKNILDNKQILALNKFNNQKNLNLKFYLKQYYNNLTFDKKIKLANLMKNKLILKEKNKMFSNKIHHKTFYSARYWWYFKLPYSTFENICKLNFKKFNKKSNLKYQTLFLKDYQSRLFNLTLNTKNKKYYLTSRDSIFLNNILYFKRKQKFVRKYFNITKNKNRFLLKKAKAIKKKHRLLYLKKTKFILTKYKKLYNIGLNYRKFLITKYKYNFDSKINKVFFNINKLFKHEHSSSINLFKSTMLKDKVYMYKVVNGRIRRDLDKRVSSIITTRKLNASAPIYISYLNFFNKKLLKLKKNTYQYSYYAFETQNYLNKFHKDMSLYHKKISNNFLKKYLHFTKRLMKKKNEKFNIDLKKFKLNYRLIFKRYNKNLKFKIKLNLRKKKNVNWKWISRQYTKSIVTNLRAQINDWEVNKFRFKFNKFMFKRSRFLFKKTIRGHKKHVKLLRKKLKYNFKVFKKYNTLYMKYNSINKLKLFNKFKNNLLKKHLQILNYLKKIKSSTIKLNNIRKNFTHINRAKNLFKMIQFKKKIEKRNFKRFYYITKSKYISKNIPNINFNFIKKRISKLFFLNWYGRHTRLNFNGNYKESLSIRVKKNLRKRYFKNWRLARHRVSYSDYEKISFSYKRYRRIVKKFEKKIKYIRKFARPVLFKHSLFKLKKYNKLKLFRIGKIYKELLYKYKNKNKNYIYKFWDKLNKPFITNKIKTQTTNFNWEKVENNSIERKIFVHTAIINTNNNNVYKIKRLTKRNRFVFYNYIIRSKKNSKFKKLFKDKKARRDSKFKAILLKNIIQLLLKKKKYSIKFNRILLILRYILFTIKRNKSYIYQNKIKLSIIDALYANLRYRYRVLIKRYKRKNPKFMQHLKFYTKIYKKKIRNKHIHQRMILVRRKIIKNFKNKQKLNSNNESK